MSERNKSPSPQEHEPKREPLNGLGAATTARLNRVITAPGRRLYPSNRRFDKKTSLALANFAREKSGKFGEFLTGINPQGSHELDEVAEKEMELFLITPR